MRLRTFTDYCLRVLIYLAVEPGRRATIGEIARAFEVSENHLMKVVSFLTRHGMLASTRGKGGGLVLARSATSISVGDVVRLAEGGVAPVECFDAATNTCVIARACRLRHVLDEALESFYATLGGYSLADLVEEPRPLARLLDVPLRRIPRRSPH